ncbi:hypothetical protein BD410DRAFT_808623 [Rickenella mellea]|uniref:BTB domain-containing protein n=1 Tax=Rickenella mellea TaxID=50990 RepID=A0A4Y7PKA9_9AGAM|nr:hypothetical protein BD410DRAFT_808623 [Rickenella mellea]
MASSSTPSISTGTRHETLYLPTGDIVLSALSNLKVTVLFRIHKFMMAHHSSIFSDMLALPTPMEDCNESYDEFDFAVVGILKLAIKYEIEPIRKHIIKQVNDAWPSTLEEWDAYEKRSASIEESGITSTDALLPEPVLCIEIGRLAPKDVFICLSPSISSVARLCAINGARQERENVPPDGLGGLISVMKIICGFFMVGNP